VRAYLDDHPLTIEKPTLASALAAAVEQAGSRGRIVVEAVANGARIPDETLQAPPEDALAGDVRFVSVEPRALVRVTLMDAADALDQAKAHQLSCARLIQSGEVERALDPLGKAIETWRAVRDALEKSLETLRTPGDPPGGAGSDELSALVQSLWTRLEEVRRSLSAQDWSALADALSYEMSDQVERWKTTLREMAEGLRPRDQGSQPR
jgi:hypothetical protein